MREIPQYLRQMGMSSMPTPQFTTAGAQVNMRASKELGDFAASMNENANKVERLRAQATMRENMHRISREIGANPAALQENLDKYRGEFIGQLPSGMRDEFNEIYRIEAIPHIDAASNMYNRNLRNDLETESLRNFSTVTRNLEEATKLLETSTIPEQRQAAAEMLRAGIAQIDEVANMRDGEGMQLFTPQQKIAMTSEAIAAPIKALSPRGQMMALNPPVGFEANLQLLHGVESSADLSHINEDGQNKKGQMTYAYRGINSDANPEEFAQLKAMIDAGKTREAAAYVDKIYKEKYWDANNIDSLPANVQGIIFDAAVNQGSGYAQELIKAVKQGATPSMLLQMREERYSKTEGTPSERRSWANRLKQFTPIAMGENADLIPVDMRDQIQKNVNDILQREQKMKMEDYGAWAQLNNIDVPTRIAQQAGRPYVQVVPNEQAKAIVSDLKKYQNVDDFINFSNQFKQQYAGGEIPAVQNLVENGLEPEMSTAVMMAVKDPNQYRPHIEAIFNWKNNNDLVKQNLSDRGEKENDIEIAVSKVWDDSDQRLAMEKKYGKGRPDELKKAMQAAAKGYMAFNPSASKEEAADFASQPFLEEYEIGKINGQVFNVPQGADASQAERRLQKFYEKKLVPLYGENFKLDYISPVLNDSEDGFYFVDPLYNRVKLPNSEQDLTVSFGELLNFEIVPNAFELRSKRKVEGVQSGVIPPNRGVQ